MAIEERHPLAVMLDLEQHTEGGYFKRTYESQTMIACGKGQRRAMTAIHYLLTSKDFSAMHIITSDEIWVFNHGSSLTLHIFDTETSTYNSVKLGDATIEADAVFQYTVPAHTWFCAEVNQAEGHTLITCAVAPGFEYKDYQIADDKEQAELLASFPEHIDIILKFTRKPLIDIPEMGEAMTERAS